LKGDKGMESKDYSQKEKSNLHTEFIDELIYENIDLNTEIIKLRYENDVLRKKLYILEKLFYMEKINNWLKYPRFRM
jgi:hypothetical protein